jgi:hypothetical protein
LITRSEDTEQSQRSNNTRKRWRRPVIAVTAVASLLFIAGCTSSPTQAADRGLATLASQKIDTTMISTGSNASPSTLATEATGGEGVTHDENPRVPEGASWTQHYFPSADDSGTELHADVLLPEGFQEGDQVTPIISVGPYFAHIGSLEEGDFAQAGPNDRFNDLITEGGALDRGYAVVLVDGRGFGGSTGCQDLGGPGERADVTAAVEWAAAQPWSTGKVGMYGKSYDAITGLIGNNLNLDQLGAVVAQEPIWDMERNFWSGGIPRETITSIGTIYMTMSFLQGMPDDEQRYKDNAADIDYLCTLQYQSDLRSTDAAYWDERDFATLAKGTDTPLFLTQGLTEWNTEPEAIQEYLENHEGPERGWVGPWDHVRGNDVDPATGALKMGRAGWYDEVFAFYDEHLKDAEPTTDVPAFAVQDNTGTWRGEETWPSTDRAEEVKIDDASYIDDGAERKADAGKDSNSYLTWSEPVTKPTRMTGTPELKFTAEGHGNAMIRLYDVAPDGTATWFNEQATAIRPGDGTIELRSTDWTLAEGHQLAIEIGTIAPSGANPHRSNDWIDSPSGEEIRLSDTSLTVPLDNPSDDTPTQGDRAAYLDLYLQFAAAEFEPAHGSFELTLGK